MNQNILMFYENIFFNDVVPITYIRIVGKQIFLIDF